MKKKLIVAVPIILTIILICIGLYIANPYMKYNTAQRYFDIGDYARAKPMFISLGSFKDSNNYIYECDYQSALSYKENGAFEEAIEVFTTIEDFKDSKEQILDIKYLNAMSYIEEEDYDNAILYLSDIKDYKDATSQLKEAQYQLGTKSYNAGDFTKAKDLFGKIQGYKDSDSLFNKSKQLSKYIGTWVEESRDSHVVISGWDISFIYGISSAANFRFELLEDGSIDTNYDIFKLRENGQSMERYLGDSYDGNSTRLYIKWNGDVPIPSEPVSPYIGMTKSELEESSWGKPYDINRTTTAYGVREQWCYSGYRYVYLEDGVVVSIQD